MPFSWDKYWDINEDSVYKVLYGELNYWGLVIL